MAEKPDTRPDCVVTGEINGEFKSVLIRDEKSKARARDFGYRKGWKDVRVIQALALAVGLCAGFAADKAQAQVTDAQQYAMVLTATELLESSNCGTPEKAVTYSRLSASGVDFRGRDYPTFFATLEAVSQIYIADPKGFCRRASLAGR